MMLSSEEQRRLDQIEADISREDPRLADNLRDGLPDQPSRSKRLWYRAAVLTAAVAVWAGVAVAVAYGHQVWIVVGALAVPATIWLLSRPSRSQYQDMRYQDPNGSLWREPGRDPGRPWDPGGYG